MKAEIEYSIEQLNQSDCKTYLIRQSGSKNVVLVDPNLKYLSEYSQLMEENEYNLLYVIDTHTHADHISGASAIKDIANVPYIMGHLAPAKCVDISVKEGDVLYCDEITMRFIYTPGHTKDSMSIVLPGEVLTGDALFLEEGGAGRDDLPGGDPGDHWESLQKFAALDENLLVYPAHDYRGKEPSSLKVQKEKNPHFQHKSKEEFIAYIDNLKLGPAEWMKAVLEANFKCAMEQGAAYIPEDAPTCEVKGTLSLEINEQSIEPITVGNLHERLSNNETPLIIDVRQPGEIQNPVGLLPGAQNIPMLDLMDNFDQLAEYRNKEIIFVCSLGGRSTTVAQIAKKKGFTAPKSLEGGMVKWSNEIGPIPA